MAQALSLSELERLAHTGRQHPHIPRWQVESLGGENRESVRRNYDT